MTKVIKSKEDLKTLLRQRQARVAGLQIIMVASGVGCVIGYKLGRNKGYHDGLKTGYVSAGHEIVEAWRKHAEEMRLARERDS